MKKFIRSDLYRYYGTVTLFAFMKAYCLVEGFKFMFWFRLISHVRKYSFFYFFILYKYRCLLHKYGIQIPRTTKIGYGFYIGHFGTIIINAQAEIGNNVNIGPGVIIGQESRGERKGAPIIEDEVWIGSNSVIVGKIIVGKGAMLAPGSYVNFDVPPMMLVMGNPGKIVKEISNDEYITNKYKI